MVQDIRKKILVVDDSEMVRKFHSYIIKIVGYEVDTAENGIIALEKLLKEDYQLIVTDINMPIMDGIELIKNIHDQGIKIPIIIVSTEDEFKQTNTRLIASNEIYLVKPTNPEKLVSTIKKLL